MLETFLSLMPDAAVAVDRDGTIVAVNVRTESFFGYSAEELEGKPIEVLIPERFRHAHRGTGPSSRSTRMPGRWGPASTCTPVGATAPSSPWTSAWRPSGTEKTPWLWRRCET